MSLLLALAAAFAVTVASDVLAIAWHAARERGDRLRGVPLAMALEAANWLPLALAIELGAGRLAIAAVLGAGVASGLGFRRLASAVPGRATIEACPHCSDTTRPIPARPGASGTTARSPR